MEYFYLFRLSLRSRKKNKNVHEDLASKQRLLEAVKFIFKV